MKADKSLHFKQSVWERCENLLQQRISNAKKAMANAQEAANSEDKSSAGDKYETSRAMGQLDREMNAKQLAEAQTELNALVKINIQRLSDQILAGSMVETNNGIYFIAAGIGTVEMEKQKVIVLSPRSPLAVTMLGKKSGDAFLYNEKKFEVHTIF